MATPSTFKTCYEPDIEFSMEENLPQLVVASIWEFYIYNVNGNKAVQLYHTWHVATYRQLGRTVVKDRHPNLPAD